MNNILLAVSTGISIFKPLYWLFGKCMGFLMDILGNQYFIAILIFTILTRMILLPFNIRQQKTTARSARLQPKIQKIQKKYPDPRDRQKMNEEMQALYAREGHNPMQMGCGTLLFQMVFLMGIVGIIYYPLSYVLGISIDSYSDQLREVMTQLGYEGNYLQLGLLENFSAYQDTLVNRFPELFTSENCRAILDYRNGMSILGLDMTAIPHWADGVIVTIPILCLVTSLGSTVMSTMIQRKNNPAMAQQASQMMLMMLIMPFFSFYVAFKVPAAVGFYWMISNIIAILQQLFISKFFPPRKSQAKLMLENTIERRSREENIKKIK